uniref:Uncharacterized protein n=1 Tax=Magallana gigas TaxID=29159 RepID=K1QBU6_MAGGI
MQPKKKQRCISIQGQLWSKTEMLMQGACAGTHTRIHLLRHCVVNGAVTYRKRKNDINEAVSVWNTLQIRPTKNVNVPAGKPRILYCLPELNGTKDYSVEADQHVLQICRNQCLFDRNIPNDSDMHALINILMEENGLILPESVEEA